MKLRNLTGLIAALVVSAALLATSALAAGEPKNEWPFTRPVGDRSTQTTNGIAQANPAIQGEPKNELPFTRVVTVTVAGKRSGFDFAWGGIGTVAGFGIALAGAGLVLAVRKSPRPT